MVGNGITGSQSFFVNDTFSWFSRGGGSDSNLSSLFYIGDGSGTKETRNSLRSSLS